MNDPQAATTEAEVVLHVRRDRPAVRLDTGQVGPSDLWDLRRYRPAGLTCARTGTVTTTCIAGHGVCACTGWTT